MLKSRDKFGEVEEGGEKRDALCGFEETVRCGRREVMVFWGGNVI